MKTLCVKTLIVSCLPYLLQPLGEGFATMIVRNFATTKRVIIESQSVKMGTYRGECTTMALGPILL